MGLTAYRKKRSFGKTPEPKGSARRAGKRLRFVVQKHAATRLHYDFRLELGGVLKSWAVPKGPSLDPADKRLAMMVEDHPFEYRTFEGTIPEGNYGAGAVMVWDEGTYVPYEESDDPEKTLRAGLHKGDLKFVLHGKKLRGAYALVKMKGRGENNWLLIKKQDEHATEDDVTARDTSAKTRRTLEEIAGGTKPGRKKGSASKRRRASVSAPPAAPKGAMPRDVKPMLATLVKEPFNRSGWLYEIKWDGYRAIGEVRKGAVRLYSRNGIDFSDRYGPVVEELASLGRDAVLDGEIVAVDETGKSDFQRLQQYHTTGRGSLVYYVFDILHLDGRDLTGLPLTRRKEVLAAFVQGGERVRLSEHVDRDGCGFFRAAEEQGLEGIIAKDGASPYQPGCRSDAWLKVKTGHRQEAVIGGFTAPRGSRKGFGALVLGVYEDGKFRYVGHTGTGFGQRMLDETYRRLHRLRRKTSPFADEPKTNAPVTWVQPKLVCEIAFSEWTGDGRMRQPVFVGFREDKPAKEVRRESGQPAEAVLEDDGSAGGSASKAADEKVESISGHRVKLTHLGKVFWPEERITKGDVIAYYRDVSSLILPYLRDRPQSLHRHPNGIEGSSFYQKDVGDQPPGWVKTKKIFSESNKKHLTWLLCQDEATLAYLANLGCIELNPWHSRANKLERPDYLLIDLDAKTCGFDTVVHVAQAVRKVFEELGLPSYPKTSGKSGMHICLPLGARYDYEQSKQFAELLMHFVHERLPDITSLERKPEKRKRKVYLDFLQNRKGQTMAAAYCLRPVPGATVSTPLEWSEVRKGLDPKRFTVGTIGKRLERKGDLWSGVLGKGVNLAKALDALSRD